MLPDLGTKIEKRLMTSVSPAAHLRKDTKIRELARSLNKIRVLSQPRPAPVQKQESDDIPTDFRDSLAVEHFAPLQVLNVKLLGHRDDVHRCKILEINDLYSKISAHLTEPFSKSNHLPKNKVGYLGLGFEEMRASLVANRFLQPVVDCIQAPKQMNFTPEQTSQLRAAGAPDLSRIKPEQFFLRENSHPSSARMSFHQLGSWYREKLSLLTKNPADNSFANSSTLYSFVFRELLKLQATECSQLAQLLLLLYTHSVTLVETGWKCSKAIHQLISKRPVDPVNLDDRTADDHKNVWADIQQLKQDMNNKTVFSSHEVESTDPFRNSQRTLNRSLRDVPIIKIAKEDELSSDGIGLAVAKRRPTSFLQESVITNIGAVGNLLAVPNRVNLASPPVVFKDDLLGNNQDPQKESGLVMRPQVFKFNRKGSKREKTTTEHTKANESLADLNESSPRDQSISERTKVLIQPISGDEHSLRSGHSVSTSSDKLSKSSEQKQHKSHKSLSQKAQ